MREVPRTNMEASHYEGLFIGLIFCKTGAAQRRGARPETSAKSARSRGIEPGRIEPGIEKGRALRKPFLVGADLSAEETPGDIPTPARATTKLFERNPVYQPRRSLEGNRRELECADTSRPAPVGNRIVNLTLTAQRRPLQPANAAAAWTLQSTSCKTIEGMRVGESGTDLSRPAGRRGKVEA